MPNLKMSGDIGFEELSPSLQTMIENGSGGGNVDVNISLKTDVLSVVAVSDKQKEFIIPKEDYDAEVHNLELRLGSVWIHPNRYSIVGNKIIFNEDETGVSLGRRLDFVFTYLTNGESNGVNRGLFKTSQDVSSFTATQITRNFIVNEYNDKKDIEIVFKNLYLVKDVDFTIDAATKVVTLNFDLNIGDVVYYIITNTSYSYSNLSGTPNIGNLNNLSTISKEIVGAINELHIKISEIESRLQELGAAQ